MNFTNQTATIVFAALATSIYSTSVQAQQDGSTSGIKFRVAQPQATTDELFQQIQQYERENQDSINQVTNVNQLRDVSPADWSYEALRSLVDRYGCIAGFPNQTYRGSQALSRYEFAAGLNSCLNQIERLIASSEAVVSEDIDTINRLTQEFEAELATIGGRIDSMESRTAFLEDNQFSTTTKLAGEVIFGLSNAFTGSRDDDTEDIDSQVTFGSRVRLELESSFTGEDLLFTRLSTGNAPSLADETGTFQGDLAFAEPADNDLGLEVLFYTFGIGESTDIIVGAAGTAADDIANTVSVLDGDGGSGAVSAFGTRSPIYLPAGDAGLGIIQGFGDNLELSLGYLASPANDPSDSGGIFNAPYSAIAQLTFNPIESLTLAATYTHSRDQSDTETGSSLANLQSFTEEEFGEAVSTVSDSYGLQASWELSDRIIVGAWGSLSKVTANSSLDGQIDRGTQTIWQWAATLALPDLGKEGNLAGLIVGMEPWVTDSSIDALGEDEDTSFRVEAFYQYQINDNIAVTPGVIWVSAPDNNSDNDDLLIGTIRTTFTF
ncbi:MAG TPA: iron uptake porin [Xenococcaceae cyanobacterium]|jgi:putative salt-induced outer membrane protein YdiY